MLQDSGEVYLDFTQVLRPKYKELQSNSGQHRLISPGSLTWHTGCPRDAGDRWHRLLQQEHLSIQEKSSRQCSAATCCCGNNRSLGRRRGHLIAVKAAPAAPYPHTVPGKEVSTGQHPCFTPGCCRHLVKCTDRGRASPAEGLAQRCLPDCMKHEWLLPLHKKRNKNPF